MGAFQFSYIHIIDIKLESFIKIENDLKLMFAMVLVPERSLVFDVYASHSTFSSPSHLAHHPIYTQYTIGINP